MGGHADPVPVVSGGGQLMQRHVLEKGRMGSTPPPPLTHTHAERSRTVIFFHGSRVIFSSLTVLAHDKELPLELPPSAPPPPPFPLYCSGHLDPGSSEADILPAITMPTVHGFCIV